MQRIIKDPVSALTHLAGAVLAIPCTVLLVLEAHRHASGLLVFAFAVFGGALFLLYTASTLYHTLHVSEKRRMSLRRIDHMMIFILIAGTYTPVCLGPLRGAWGWTLLALVWGFAVFGITLKALWMNAPRLLSTGIYVIMGWLVLIAFYPLTKAVSTTALWLLACGGLTYTLGAVIYAAKWPPLLPRWFGFHDLFHIFVLGGSALHVLFMFRIIPA